MEERLESLKKEVTNSEKVDAQVLKLQQEIMALEKENHELKKSDKTLRKEYFAKVKELENKNLKVVTQKNREIEE